MHKWEHVRQKAREYRSRVCSAAGLDPETVDAAALVAAAAGLAGYRLMHLPAGHRYLRGAVARTEDDLILFDRDVDPMIALYNQAHELAHLDLGHGLRVCGEADIDVGAVEAKIPFGVHRVEGYGPQERIETEANVFAREFLLPGDLLGRWFIQEKLGAEAIATKTGFASQIIYHQLAYALLVPRIEEDSPQAEEAAPPRLKLDDSQRDAARIDEGPQLVSAGPGTGKTRTLVGRVLHLLDEGVDARKILVLTFSNKAVGELRERIYAYAPQHAPRLTVETFHSFGLELLRKYGTSIGLPAKPDILDPIESILLLEEMLPDLELSYYEVLYEPARYLGDIVRAISRAKDENVSPDGYAELAQKQRAAAKEDTEIEAAEKAIEIARVYAKYQERLARDGCLDISDLICRSIELLREKAAVRAIVRNQFRHVLVDEFQDVNRASGLLLKELVGDGRNLWAVGDVRQSIHRWRGATTANITNFSADYPGAKAPISLAKNYRSRPGIVEAFSELAPKMKAATEAGFIGWESVREEGQDPRSFHIAVDREAEAVGIGREIERLRRDVGIPYRDQAVICRTHTTLDRIAGILEREGIPVLYLGDLFERPEIRDLLSLLQLTYEAEGRGLIRVAGFREYSVPLADVLTLREASKERGIPFPRAIVDLAGETAGVSEPGRTGFALLGEHIDGLSHGQSAWKTLTRYLFDRSEYLTPLLADGSVAGQQKRLAIYQLLRFIHSRLDADPKGLDPKHALLRYIRRLEIFGDEKQLRQTDEWADAIDAVRILTIHASKGLEFPAVFIPTLATSYLPMSRPWNPCPPPDGLTGADKHAEEEECLFFVGMSRAEDFLRLSRALTYGKPAKKPSVLLDLVKVSFPDARTGDATWTEQPGEEQAASSAISYQPPEVFTLTELEVYRICPRRYLYEYVLGLSGRGDDTAYLQFHKCVYATLREMQTQMKEGRIWGRDEAEAFLNERWAKGGPLGHHFEGRYKLAALEMIEEAVTKIVPTGDLLVDHIDVTLSSGKVRFRFDHAEVDHETIRVRRFKTGRPTKNEIEKKPIYGLLTHAMKSIAPQGVLELQHLGRNAVIEVDLDERKVATRLAKYDDAMSGINRGEFQPDPQDYSCNRCPHYFICPAVDAAGAHPILK